MSPSWKPMSERSRITLSSRLEALIIKHEGFELKPYTCAAGKLSISVGVNLEEGITAEEAMLLFRNRLSQSVRDANTFPWFKGLDDVRQDVVISMIYNLGLPRLKGFKKMIGALMNKDYKEAAKEMLFSEWSEQVGPRAKELSKMMEIGAY